MVWKNSLPITEFDASKNAIIEPSETIPSKNVPTHCVICFFNDFLKRLARDTGAKIHHIIESEHGVHPVYEIEFKNQRLAFVNPCVGSPLAAITLETVIALGCKKFVVCGGAGIIKKEIAIGDILLVESALRDEGTSYHYQPPSREIKTDTNVLSKMEEYLKNNNIPYHLCKTWTTDAPYRETLTKIVKRQKEGFSCVEMEAAAFLAVAAFRNVKLGQILYAGDDVSGEKWNKRDWNKLSEIRENLFWLACEICINF